MTKPSHPWIKKRPCIVCGANLPANATKCNACQSFQDIRRHFAFPATVFSLLVAVVGVASAVFSAYFYVRDYHSQTAFKVTGSDRNVLYVKVWNTGRKPSKLLSYTLRFGSLPIGDATLEIIKPDQQEAKSVIMPGQPVKVGLWVPHELELYDSGTLRRYSKDEIRALLKDDRYKTMPLTLVVNVEESNDSSDWHPVNIVIPMRSFHARSDTFPGDWASEFLLASMSG